MRTTISLLALFSLLAPLHGCSSKKALDARADHLRLITESNDYAAFKQTAHPNLVAQFAPDKLALASKALSRLGAFKERTMTGVEVDTKGNAGDYRLRYEKGVVSLKIKVDGGKLVALRFHGEDFAAALRAISAAALATFKVKRFVFLEGPGGKEKTNNVYTAGQPVGFRMVVQGLKRRDDKIDFRVAFKVKSGDKVLLDRPRFLVKQIPLAAKGPALATVNGHLTPPRAGTFELAFVFEDRVASRSLQHAQALMVKPAAKK